MRLAPLLVILMLSGGVAVPAAPTSDGGICAGDDVGDRSAGPAQNGAGRDMAIDDIYWCNDRRLTDNGAEERLPAIVVDSGRYGYVSFYRGEYLHFKKIDRLGNELFAEKQVAWGQPYFQPCGQPAERIGVDSKDDIHMLWKDPTSQGPMYQKFASNGSAIVQPLNLSPIANEPRGVGMAVGSNGYAYIAHENGGSCRAEMAYLDNDTGLHTGYLAGMYCKGVTIGVNGQDCPYVFYKNGTAPGLWMTIFSPQGQLMQSPTRIDTPLAGTGWDAPFPSLAFGSDGAVYMLQASRASGTKTLYYTKLGPDGTKLTSDIPVTSTACDYGDICVDGKRNVFIVWGNASDDELYYVHIEPNKENETLEPHRLTETSGFDRDPRIVADQDGSLHVVWVSNRDGNWEVYYIYGYTFGVDVGMTPEEMNKIQYVHLNKTRSANITVTNTGGLNNTVFLSLDADLYGKAGGFGKDYAGEGYKIWIDEENEQLDLDPQEIRKVPVHVRGPLNGTPGEYIKVIVNGSCQLGSTHDDSVEFRVYLDVDTRIKLECPEDVHMTMSGVPTDFSLSITNIGEINASISISAKGPTDWNYSLNRSGVWLGPAERHLISLEVTPPPYAVADEVGVVTVTAWRSDVSTVKETVKTTTVVSGVLQIDITPDRTEATVDPGAFADYILTIGCHGNRNGYTNFRLEIISWVNDWSVSLDAGSIALAAEESGFVVLRVGPPLDALAGSSLPVRVACYDLEKRFSAECCVTTFAGQVHALELSVSPALLSVDPGGTATFRVDVSNLGNGPDVCRFESLVAPSGLNCSVRGQDGQISMGTGIAIPYKGTGWFDVVVGAPADALAGERRFTGKVSDGSGRPYELAFTVDINQVYGLSLGSTAPQQAGDLRQWVEFSLGIGNTGNGNDTFHLTATGLPAGWREVEFRDADNVIGNRSVLAAQMTGPMTAVVEIPESTPLDRAWFNVTATSSGGPSATIGLQLTVRKPDLLISKVELRSSILKVDKPAMVRVSVRNNGDGPAGSITVSYYRNGLLRTTEELGTLLPGQERSVDFVWVPLDGRNELRFAVDPLDSVCESNETNNGAMMQKWLYKDSTHLLQDNTWMAIVAAVPLILAALVLAARAGGRRRR